MDVADAHETDKLKTLKNEVGIGAVASDRLHQDSGGVPVADAGLWLVLQRAAVCRSSPSAR